MRPSRNNLFLLLAFASIIAGAKAQQTYQDSSALNTWNSTDLNWSTGPTTWANTTSSDAIFGGTGETVTVSAVNARNVTFNSTGYVLSGGTITLGAASTFTANQNVTLNSATAGGTTSVTKAGTGSLTLGGGNAFTGQLIINAGRIAVNSGGTQGNANNATGNLASASSIAINNGGTLEFLGSSTTNVSTGANTVGSNFKPITVNSGGTLISNSINSMGYWNQNQYPNITMAGGTFTLNYPSYINSITLNSASTVNGASALQFWQTSGNAIACNVDSTIASGVRINDNNVTFNTAAATTLNITGILGNFNGNTTNSTTKAGFSKTGTGTLLLSGTNTFGGIATVSAGMLKLGNNSALGGTTNGTSVVSGAALDLNGKSLGTEALTLNGTGISSGGALINSSATPASSGGTVSLATAGSIGGSGDITLNGALSGTASLTKSGTGTLTLANANAGYTGGITVNQGKLSLTQSTAANTVTVADGATLEANGNGSTITAGNTTLGTTTGARLKIPNLLSGNPVALTVGNLALNGNTVIHAAGTFDSNTSYPLVSSTSRSGGGGFSLFPLPHGVSGSLSDDGTTVTLNITTIQNVTTTWKGGASAAWDVNTTANWKTPGTDPDLYFEYDNVLFDGTATNTNLTLDTVVTPSSVVFDHDDPVAYTLSGTGSITGSTGIVKSGSGALSLGVANTFTGEVTLNSGSITLTNGGALGGTSGITVVKDAATLDLNGQTVGTESVDLEGALVNNNATAASLSGTVFLFEDSLLGGSGSLTLSGTVGGADTATLQKTGAGTLLLSGNNAFGGIASVTEGTLKLGNAGALGSTTNGTAVSSGAVLDLNGQTVGTEPLTITGTGITSGGALINSSATNASIGGDVSLTGDASIGGRITLGGAVTGIHSLTKVGTGNLTLSSVSNTHSETIISGGTVSIASELNLGAGTLGFSAVGTGLTITGTAVSLPNNLVFPTSGTGNITILTPINSSTIFSGTLSGGGAETTLFFQGGTQGTSSGALALTGNNAGFNGLINVQRGPLILANSNAAGSAKIILDSNNNANGALQLAGSFILSNEVKINFQSQRIGVGTGLFSGISGVISENSVNGLEKVGAGTLTVSNTNTYTGTTLVTEGTLRVNGSLHADSDVSVSSSASIGGSGTIGGDLSLASGATFEVVDINDALSVSGNVIFSGFGFSNITGWDYQNAAPGTYTLIAGSPANINLANVTHVGIENALTLTNGNKAYFQNGSLQVVIVAGAAGFSSWIADAAYNVPPSQRGPNDDPDSDGVSNLIEYAIAGRNPGLADGPVGTLSGMLLSYAKRAEAAADPAISYRIIESDDLGTSDPWQEVPAYTTNNAMTISYTLPTGKPKTFAKLAVNLTTP